MLKRIKDLVIINASDKQIKSLSCSFIRRAIFSNPKNEEEKKVNIVTDRPN